MPNHSLTLRRVAQARTSLLLEEPFFGVLSMQLTLREDDTINPPTACTDGTMIAFHPDFVATLTDAQLMGLLAHEVMHCACGHPWRRDHREPVKWNHAADYPINGLLLGARFQLPPDGLVDAQYDGKSSEWIFDRLPDDPSGPGCAWGLVMDAPKDAADGEPVMTAEDWQQAVAQATKIAEAQGKLPASLKRDVGLMTAPPVDWRALLARWFQDITNADYTWTRPNRRYLVTGLYLPSLRSVACGKIAVAVDTSGSIDAVLLAQFSAAFNAIVSECSPSSVDVFACDACIQSRETFERGDVVTLSAKGGGGTDFRPVFDALRDDPPVALIYLTDLAGTFPTEAPEYPVIWACSERGETAPFGDVVECVS